MTRTNDSKRIALGRASKVTLGDAGFEIETVGLKLPRSALTRG